MHCPQSEAGSKPIQLRQSMLEESDNKPGIWYINAAQYRGWTFYDNLESPRWVWVLQESPTLKPDIYPPYDNKWRQKGAKRMEDKDIGYLIKPMIDETMLLDDKHRLRTMEKLNQIGKTAEVAYLENSKAREEAQSETRNHNQENESEGGECGEGQSGSTKQSSTATSLKRKARTEELSESEQSKQGEQGTKQVQSGGIKVTRDTQQTPGDQNQEMETKQGGTGGSNKWRFHSKGIVGRLHQRSKKWKKQRAKMRGTRATGRIFPKGNQPVPLQNLEEKKKGGEGEEGEDSEESSSEDGWEDTEDEEDEDDEEPETIERWVKCMQALEWEITVECEVCLAHHKHLRNLKDAMTTMEGLTTTNRFEILKKEKEINDVLSRIRVAELISKGIFEGDDDLDSRSFAIDMERYYRDECSDREMEEGEDEWDMDEEEQEEGTPPTKGGSDNIGDRLEDSLTHTQSDPLDGAIESMEAGGSGAT
ncbi:hypothetical protein CBR_g30151 [Chara braunii]|uniref:Uncharacterized protein n=1 Tax=Chara braunii TaxID=69332 RepID=A0A388LC71_CHABU|nr:hypothetical protein CBR_g30151 [Chara braunii]|eukprot:GBG79886.1 hypothetical protein CBR_g30151 [Chara braunii]